MSDLQMNGTARVIHEGGVVKITVKTDGDTFDLEMTPDDAHQLALAILGVGLTFRFKKDGADDD